MSAEQRAITQVQRIRTDPHSPSRYRVDGTVFNIPEFAKAFNCSPKSKVSLDEIIMPLLSNEANWCIVESAKREAVYILGLRYTSICTVRLCLV